MAEKNEQNKVEGTNNGTNQADNSLQDPAKSSAKVELRSEANQPDQNNRPKNKKIYLIAAGIVILAIIITTGIVLALPGREVKVNNDNNEEDSFGNLPATAPAPHNPTQTSGLSGRECPDSDRRPIGVMLASDVVTRPVSGFAQADMVFELPVLVSDVTRFLAVYQCGRPEDIGSVRSARHDYLFLAKGVDAIVAHWGGSYHALNRIEAGEFNTINALNNPFSAFFRKNELPRPYNGFTTYENLWNALQKLGYRAKTTFKGYGFKDDPALDQRPAGGTLSIAWPGSYRVRYEYNPQTNRYQRYWGGTKQIDGGADKKEVAPSAIAIMRADNQYAEGPGGYNDVGIEGKGELEVYQDGKVIKGTWEKNKLYKTDPVKFMNEQGEEITFTRGQLWVMAVEPNIAVTWEKQEVTTQPSLSPSPAN